GETPEREREDDDEEHETRGAGQPELSVLERLAIDEEPDGGRRRERPARREDVDLGEGLQGAYQADDHYVSGYRAQERQQYLPEHLERRRAVHLGRLDHFARDPLEGGA